MTEPPRLSSLDELRPDFRGVVLQWRDALAHLGVAIRILETRRTPERQQWLYEQGRARPGKIVTNIRGDDPRARHVAEPGRATALDFAFAGPDPWKGPWEMAGQMAEHVGMTWGGRWKMRDLGHVEWNRPDPTRQTT